jgi:dihydrofolate synthase/folylpolyglutamate synthase
VSVTNDGTRWTLADKTKTKEFFPAPLDLSIKLIGEIQAENTSLAILAVRKAFPDIDAKTIVEAVARVRLPARFEKVLDAPLVIVDGAHTEISVRLCAKTFTRLYRTGGVLLFGCATGKDAGAMARELVPHFSKIIITTPGTYKTSDPKQVHHAFRVVEGTESGSAPSKIEFIENTKDAVIRALNFARENGLPVLGAGSFYLAAEIRDIVANLPGKRQ